MIDRLQLRRTGPAEARVGVISLPIPRQYAGQVHVGTAMQPGPEGIWGMPEAMRRTLPGYDPDIAKSRAAC